MVWRVWGSGSPVVLVHGGAGAWSHWIRNLPALTRTHTVIAPDLPGLGDSASPPSPYSPESIAEIAAAGLADVLERVARGEPGTSGPEVAICGFSFGGMLCGLVAERIAPRVRRVVLIGASGLGGRFAPLAPVSKLPAGAGPAELEALHRRNLGIMMIHDPARIDALALLVQATNAPRTRVMSPEHALSHKLEDALRRSGLPFDSLWGEHCIFAPDLDRRREVLAAIRPDTTFHVIAGAGHWAQYEAPDVVTELLETLVSTERGERTGDPLRAPSSGGSTGTEAGGAELA